MAPRIGKFEISRRLGRGGMGAVYEGYDLSLARRVAVKTLTAELISDHDSRRRFEREAQAAAKLQHPSIITIYELGNFGSEGKPYIVMEYLEGFDLSTLIADIRPIPLVAAMGIGAQLCRALDYAHQHDIVHRDVKPSNVRYLFDGRIKIMDFGIARMDGAAQITRSGVMVGTPHYMSPEQIRGTELDGRSDIFSAGCIFYEMLAGVRPFQGESTTSVLYKIVHESPPSIMESRPDIPDQVEHILTQALAKEPENRFGAAREMAVELERVEAVYQRTLARLSAQIERRLRELGSLRRAGRWTEVLALAEEIAIERPDLEVPWHARHQAALAIGKRDLENRLTPDEEARHLSEISKEISVLSLDVVPNVETVGRAVGDLLAEAPVSRSLEQVKAEVRPDALEEPVDGPESTAEPRARTGLWVGSVVAAAAIVILVWMVWPQLFPGKSAPEHPSLPREAEKGAAGDDRPVKTTTLVPPVDPDPRAIATEETDLPAADEPNGRAGTLPEEVREPEASTEPVLEEGEPAEKDLPDASTEPDAPPAIAESPLTPEGSPAREIEEDTSVESKEDVPEVIAPRIVGMLRIRSQYPLSVLREDEALAEAVSDVSVDLEVGRQEIILFAPDVFLKQTLAVDIEEGRTEQVYAPELGRASIRAFPENGSLTIDGLQANDLPVTDMPIVEGPHTFTFLWPNGRSTEETIVVQKGKRVYVTGQYRR